MSIHVLGPLRVDHDGALAPRDRVVLAALVIADGEVVSSEALADALWREQPPASWLKVVQGSVVRLRKVLGASAIETHGAGYRLAVPPDEVDAHRFERLLGHARELLTLGEPDRAEFVVDEALSCWRGRAFAELEEWELGRIEAARLEELRMDAEELRVDAALQAGRYREVLAEAQVLVARVPVREHRWMLLALAQHQAGRQGEALRTLHQARLVLGRELGLDPGADLVALEGAILRQDPSLIAARLPASSPVCPYPGLSAYDVEDADWFFGRDAEIAECLERLAQTGMLAVVGPSGSGKSSLLRAGVAASLRRQGRRVVVITPGSHPLAALAPLGASAEPTVLIVDQCEEAVTMCSDPDERIEFFRALVAHAESAPLIVGLRADRLTDATTYAGFAGLVERGLYLLRRMGPENVRAAIESPARQAGLLLEPGLVDLLVRDVEGEPGSLPLLSHALYETWERRQGSTLTVAGYQVSGGIRGAVAQSAEHLYEQQSLERRRQLRDLMLRLVVPSPDGEPARARVPRRIAAPDADREMLVDALADARLLTSDSESVELAHEALARAWPRLRDWLDDDVEGQRIWRHLAAAADAWEAMGGPDSELYRGVRLARATEWRDLVKPDLSVVERTFLDASVALDSSERTNAERELRRRARTNRRLRVLAAAVAVLAITASVGGIAANRQAAKANSAARVARAHELVASAAGVIDQDPSVAKLLAVAAADVGAPSLATEAVLHRTWAQDLTVARWGFTDEAGVLTGELDPTGTRLAAAGMFQPDGAGPVLRVVDPYTDELLWSVDSVIESGEASAVVTEPFFADGGRHVIAGWYWDPYSWRRPPIPFEGVDEPLPHLLGAHVWDADTGGLVERIDLGRCGGEVTAASSTSVLAKTLHGPPDVLRECRWRDGTVGIELIDRQSGERTVLSSDVGALWQWGAAMSGDGSFVAYDDGVNAEIVVVDVATQSEVMRTPGAGVRGLNADGSLLLVGSEPIDVVDTSTARVVASLDVRQQPNLNARFDPTGRYVYTSGEDSVLRKWDATSGSEVFSYPGVGGGPVSIGDSGLVVVSNPDQQILTIVDPERRGETGAFRTCDGAAVPDSLGVTGELMVVSVMCDDDRSATAFVIDLDSGRTVTTIAGRAIAAPAVSPDGARIADQASRPAADGRSGGGAVTVRDVRTGETLLELESLPDGASMPVASRLRWSPDGRLIAAAMGSDVAVWDATTGSLLEIVHEPGDRGDVADVLFTPDSRRLISTPAWWIVERSVDTWEVIADREVSFDGGYRVGLTGFDPSGGQLLAVGGFQSNAASALVRLDSDDFGLVGMVPNAHEASVTAAALSPTGDLVATSADDGSVRVWDATDGHLVHDVAGAASVALATVFVDEDHLAIAAGDGRVLEVTIDPDELLDDVRQSLTKGFSLSDCDRFNFGDECPTLAELGVPLTGTRDLDGTFKISWTASELVSVADEAATEIFGRSFAPGALDGLGEDFSGDYSLTFSSRGRFDLDRADLEEPACSGTYFARDGHVWLRSERGVLCYPIKFFDAEFEISGSELRFDPLGSRIPVPMLLVLATRLLRRST